MPRWADPIIRAAERRVDVPMDYLRRIADTSRVAFVKFGMFLPLAAHRQRAEKSVWHLARLAATQAQDCGTCVQVVVNDARRDGVPVGTLRAALTDADTGALTDDERLALAYGRAVSAQAPDVDAVVAAVRERWSEAVLVELALAVAAAQVFPVVKRGMGLAVACALVTVDV